MKSDRLKAITNNPNREARRQSSLEGEIIIMRRSETIGWVAESGRKTGNRKTEAGSKQLKVEESDFKKKDEIGREYCIKIQTVSGE